MSRLGLFAALAAVSFVVHGGNHLLRGEAHDLLWLCNVAPAVLAVGCAARRAGPVAVAVLWLTYGTPMWALDMLTGGEVIVTSFLPHVVCLSVGVAAARELGVPRRAWLRASLGMIGLMVASRLVTPPGPNVNLVFSVWAGWEGYFPRHDLYLLLGVASSTLTFVVFERVLAGLAPTRLASNPPPQLQRAA